MSFGENIGLLLLLSTALSCLEGRMRKDVIGGIQREDLAFVVVVVVFSLSLFRVEGREKVLLESFTAFVSRGRVLKGAVGVFQRGHWALLLLLLLSTPLSCLEGKSGERYCRGA